MEQNDGKLSTDQRKKVREWINSKATLIGKCPCCGARDWMLLEHFVDLPIYRGGAFVAGAISYPNFGIICGNCTNTQLFNAVLSGILDEQKTDNSNEKNQKPEESDD